MSKLREMAEKNSRIAKSRKRDANGRMLPTSLEEKFWSKVDKSSGCWQWTGSKNANGYGYIARTKTEPTLLAHRVSLRVHGTEIPSGLVVDHICRNRACVNPKHLRVVTRLVNTFENSESFVVKNKAKTHCPKGHEYAGENVRHYRSGGGHTSRTCMACCRARAKASKDRKKAHAREDIPFLLSELAKLQAENATLRRQVEAAKEMRDLLHLRLRYCPEALWLEENYIKLKDALAALERGGSNGQN